MEGEKTQVQIRAEIDSHLKEKAKVEATVPQSMVVGPFFINTDSTRLALAKKHKDIALALLEYLANHLRKITEEVCMYVCKDGKSFNTKGPSKIRNSLRVFTIRRIPRKMYYRENKNTKINFTLIRINLFAL